MLLIARGGRTSPVLPPGSTRPSIGCSASWPCRGAQPPAVPSGRSLDFYFRRVAVDGMTDPFFLETLANQGLLPLERPFVVAHEWGHLAGYAEESEANFLAWLICMRGGDATRYSAWISLFGTIVSALPADQRDAESQRLQSGPREDLRAMSGANKPGGQPCREPRRLRRVRSLSESESRALRSAKLQRSHSPSARHAIQPRRLSRASLGRQLDIIQWKVLLRMFFHR